MYAVSYTFQEEVAARGKQVMNITIDLAAWINLTSSPTTLHDIQELDVLVAEMKRSALNTFRVQYIHTLWHASPELSTVCILYS